MSGRIAAAVAALLFLHGGPLTRAQDAVVGDFNWLHPEDADGRPPEWSRRPKLKHPERVRDSKQIAYVIAVKCVDGRGKWVNQGVVGTDKIYAEEVHRTLDAVKVRPAERNNQPGDAKVWFAILFNPASAGTKAPDATPRLLETWPAFRMILPGSGPPPRPVAHIAIAADGTHTLRELRGALTPAERSQAEAAVGRWRFAPARQAGRPAEATVDVPVLFVGIEEDSYRVDWPPQVTSQTAPVYPFAMRKSGMRGEVMVAFIVGADGSVREAAVERSNNPAFDQPAIDAVLRWRFEPGRKRGVAVNTRMRVPIYFQLEDTPGGGAEAYQVSKKSADQGRLPPEFRYDTAAKPKGMVVPVYPHDLLVEGLKGSATVAFVVDADGRVTATQVRESTHPAFGKAVQAMVDMCEFEPARREGEPVPSVLHIKQTFEPATGGDARLPDGARSLLGEERRAGSRIYSLGQLDAPVRPRSRRAPVYPSAQRESGADGEAVVEFLVDAEGHVRLPRVRSASHEDFGYAAVQAVAQWSFSPPLKDGKPVTLRAVVPVLFKMEKRPAAP